MFKKMLVAMILAFFFCGPAFAADMPKQLNFGIISTESTTALEKSFGPFMKDLETCCGQPERMAAWVRMAMEEVSS